MNRAGMDLVPSSSPEGSQFYCYLTFPKENLPPLNDRTEGKQGKVQELKEN